jgi:hypothetical protein
MYAKSLVVCLGRTGLVLNFDPDFQRDKSCNPYLSNILRWAIDSGASIMQCGPQGSTHVGLKNKGFPVPCAYHQFI